MHNIKIQRRTNRKAVRSPDIDGFLSDATVTVLYKRWKNDKWENIIILHGGIPSITCDMVKDVGFQQLSKVYGVRRAKVLMVAAERGSLF